MGALENKCLLSQRDILHMKFSEFYLCFHNSCEFWHLFSRVPIRNCLWCYYRKLITSIVLENCKKNNAILFLLFWYKVFVHSVLKLFNFLVDSVLIPTYPREPSVYLLREELDDVENISWKNTSDITKLSYQAKNLINSKKQKNKNKQTKQNINICINLDQSSRLGKEIPPKLITESSTTPLCKVIGQTLNLMLP